jgi:serine/threonine protein kinase
MRELLSALDFIHSKGVIHRDVKPSNIVVDKEGKLTILDFDLAEFLTPYTKLNFSVATKGFKAPESFLRQKKYDFRFDIYSAGCILLGILFKESPFFDMKKDEEVWHSNVLIKGFKDIKAVDKNGVISKDYQEKWGWVKKSNLLDELLRSGDENASEYAEAIDLAELMTTVDYTKRPMAKELLAHPFFNEPE